MTARRLTCTPEEYHASTELLLSQSIATTIVTRTPRHAWLQHPALGATDKAPTKEMDTGTAAHALVLGKGSKLRIVEANDWRTNAAKEAREEARAAGEVPVLAAQHNEIVVMAGEIRSQLAALGIDLCGDSEAGIEWEEQSALFGPVRCRGMMDHLIEDAGKIYDLKIVHDASNAAIERSAIRYGYDIQRSAYVRALEQLRPDLAGRVDFVFLFCEAEYPHLVNPVRGDGAFRELGDRRWQRAVNEWACCLSTNTWPGYGAGINQLTAPAWAVMREEYGA